MKGYFGCRDPSLLWGLMKGSLTRNKLVLVLVSCSEQGVRQCTVQFHHGEWMPAVLASPMSASQTRAIREEGTVVEKVPPSERLLGKPVHHFLSDGWGLGGSAPCVSSLGWWCCKKPG